MTDLKARIGPKVTKIYPNLSWKRPGTDLKSSPQKSTVQTRQNDVDDDSDASSHEFRSQPFSSPTKCRNRTRLRESNGSISLLNRMGLNYEGGASSGGDALSIQQPSLLPRVGTIEDTPRSCSNLGSTAHVLDPNGHHNTANARGSLPSSSNTFITEQQPLNLHNGSSPNNPNGDHYQKTCSIVEPSTIETLSSPKTFPKSILQDSSKSNYSSNNIREASQTREDNLATKKNMAAYNLTPPSQENEFEEGEEVESQPLPSQQVRDFLLPLVLTNAAHRVKEGDSDLSRHTAHSVLSDEVCSSFMDKMKEVRTEMHTYKIRSSNNPPQTQLAGETNKPGLAAHALPSSKIGQVPPRAPHAMIYPKTSATQSSSLKDQPHSHNPVPSSVQRRREAEFRRTPSPEGRGFYDHDRGYRYPEHRDPTFDGHRSRSDSLSGPSRGQPYYRPSDSSRHIDRFLSPVTHYTGGPSRSTYLHDRSFCESPESIPGRRSDSPPGMPERRQSFSRDFTHMERHMSHDDSSQSRWHSGRGPEAADKVVNSRRPSFTHHRGPKVDEPARPRRDNHVGIPRPGLEFARRSASPQRKQYRQSSSERSLARTPPLLPTPYCRSPERGPKSYQSEKRRDGGAAPPPERRRDWYMDLSPGAGSTSSYLTSSAAGSHHQATNPMVIDNHEKVTEQVGMGLPKTSEDLQKLRRKVLPCHNVPGVWFAKVGLNDIGTLECSFEVDEVTAINWNLRLVNGNLPNSVRKERLQLNICCLSQKHVQTIMGSLKPDATAQDVVAAMFTIENDWPTPGHLIIMVNPQNKNKKIWLPHKLEPSCLPVCIEGCISEGQNIVQFIQLSGMSERMFVLFATAKPVVDELLQHDDYKGFVLAPLQNTIDGGGADVINFGFEQVTIC